MTKRILSMAEAKALADSLMDPNQTDAELNRRMGQVASILGIDNRRRRSNAEEAHLTQVAKARSSGDLATLRELANENLKRSR